MSEKEAATIPEIPFIITHQDMRFPVLQQKSMMCDFPLSEEDRQIVDKMKEHLAKLGENAVGIAAVQIGVARNLFVMRRNDGSIIECVNPYIEFKSIERSKKPEGCLSLPEVFGNISRPKSITLSYYDSYGGRYLTEFTGLEAKIVAHEMDHLSGVMIINHMEADMEKNHRLEEERKLSKQKAKDKRRKMAKIHRKNNRR